MRDFIDIRHVKAPQDRDTAFSKLMYASQLNVIMNEFANRALKMNITIKHSVMIPHLPVQAISFRSPHERLTRNVINKINRAKIGHEAETYIKQRWPYDDKKIRKVLWKEFGNVIDSAPFFKKNAVLTHPIQAVTYYEKKLCMEIFRNRSVPIMFSTC